MLEFVSLGVLGWDTILSICVFFCRVFICFFAFYFLYLNPLLLWIFFVAFLCYLFGFFMLGFSFYFIYEERGSLSLVFLFGGREWNHNGHRYLGV